MKKEGGAIREHRWLQNSGWYAIALLLAASVAGCHSATPTSDRTRESHVLEIIWGLRNVKAVYGDVPANYLDLTRYGFKAPLDPVRRKPYRYTQTGNTVTVCANFEDASPGWDGSTNAAVYGDPVVHGFGSWSHGPGRRCLTRDISSGKH